MTANPVLTIIANGTTTVTPASRGRYLIVVGATGGVTFDSASIVISQLGVTLKDVGDNALTAITAAGRYIVDGIIDNEDISFVTTSVVTASDVDIVIHKLAAGDLIA
jgi:hypothetical protein